MYSINRVNLNISYLKDVAFNVFYSKIIICNMTRNSLVKGKRKINIIVLFKTSWITY